MAEQPESIRKAVAWGMDQIRKAEARAEAAEEERDHARVLQDNADSNADDWRTRAEALEKARKKALPQDLDRLRRWNRQLNLGELVTLDSLDFPTVQHLLAALSNRPEEQ